MSFKKKFSLIFMRSFSFIYSIWRLFIGPMDACIYPISCSEYAAHQLKSRRWYIAFPLIGLRVLSCNPLTAIFLRIYYAIIWRAAKK